MTTNKRPAVEITLRIPGAWRSPDEILERLPSGYRMLNDRLVLPDQTEISMFPIPADHQFPDIFRSSLRRPATADELKIVNRYSFNVGLAGPGGSLESACTMMQAGAAIIHAGGAGVFIDNSGLAHGAEAWLEMTEDGSSDAISFAFVAIVRATREVYTLGMQVPGLPDIVMKRADAEADDQSIIKILRYLCASDRSIGDGHIISVENGGRFTVRLEFPEQSRLAEPMRNPSGRLRLVSFKEIAEQN